MLRLVIEVGEPDQLQSATKVEVSQPAGMTATPQPTGPDIDAGPAPTGPNDTNPVTTSGKGAPLSTVLSTGATSAGPAPEFQAGQ